MDKIIGLDIGGTKILGALFDENGNILKKVKKSSKSDKSTDKVKEQIKKVIDELIDENEAIYSIGCGVPGVIEKGKVRFTPNMPITGLDLKGFLEEEYNTKAYVGNDANVAIYGEYKHGEISVYKNVVGFFIGTGFGGGIITDGKIYTGSIGAAAEIGHMTVNPDGPYCGCGSRGCLEIVSAKVGIQNAIKNQIFKGRKSILEEEISKNSIIKSSELLKAYDENDEVTVEVIDDAAKYIGIGAANIMNAFNPEIIILGGGLMESFGEKLISKIENYAKRYAIKQNFESCKFKISSLGDDACIYGAYQIAKDKME